MRKLALIGTTVITAAVLSAAPVSVKWSGEQNLSVTQDKAFAYYYHPYRYHGRYYAHRYYRYGHYRYW